MRILFLTSRLPYPPDRGDRLRTNQFLRLFAREHALTLVSFISSERERAHAEELRAYCEQIHLVHLRPWNSALKAALNIWRDYPLQTLYYRSRRMKRTVDRLLSEQSFDLAFVHLFRMAPYLLNHPQLYRILDLTDLVSYELRSSLPYQPWPWRTIYRLEEPRIARYERQIASRFDEVWFISKRDSDLLAESGVRAQVKVIPSAVENDLYLLEQTISGPSRLLFYGNLNVRHNLDAARFMAEEIMPLILLQEPTCELQIVGAGNVENIVKLGDLPGVRVTGYVPNLQTAFGESTISVAPLRFSAGVQFKVIESMAAGLPVVTTSSVSAGLGSEATQVLLVADSAAVFAEQVVRLLQDERLRLRLGRAGREFVRTHFNSSPAVARLRAIEELTGRA